MCRSTRTHQPPARHLTRSMVPLGSASEPVRHSTSVIRLSLVSRRSARSTQLFVWWYTWKQGADQRQTLLIHD